MLTSILIAIVVAGGFGLIASVVFSWASNRSAAWNLAFGSVLVLGAAAVLLLSVLIAMRRFSP
jgi:hypothetical protein